MGHIMLATPVVHIWFLRSLPSKIGAVLGLSTKDLEKITYYETYVVVNPGRFPFKKYDLLSDVEYQNIMSQIPEEEKYLDDDDPNKFVALMGGQAIKELLKRVDVEDEYYRLRQEMRDETNLQKKQELLKRLKVLEAFLPDEKTGEPINKPEWMVLDVIPVIPPDLRPLIPLEGGRFAASDLNDLYRRVIIRNNRLKRLIDIKAPGVIIRNEQRRVPSSNS
jgi:DNA-directed RNA polymerase subunit beta' (EC 2.7.7.6)